MSEFDSTVCQNTSLTMFAYIYISCPQSYNQALKSHVVTAGKESIATKLHVLQNKRRYWEFALYPKGNHDNLLRCHVVFKVKIQDGRVNRY